MNPTNALSSDDTYSTSVVSLGQSKNLEATGFGFAIPTGATIDGIKIEVEAKSTATGFGNDFTVWAINPASGLKGGAIIREATASDAYYTFGGPTEKFGGTWTAANINSADFGCSVRFYDSGTGTHSVDHIRITVYYTEASGTPFRRSLLGVGF
ncbi:MAG: hypothetical protein PHE83_18255 [Opitutaceae bacterium]|nr:hypothetical protein [Opitutaceae bacterium]